MYASQAALSKLRSQAAVSAREWAAKNGALASEKDSLIRQHVSLKAGLSAFRASQALRLKQLSVSRCCAVRELDALKSRFNTSATMTFERQGFASDVFVKYANGVGHNL